MATQKIFIKEKKIWKVEFVTFLLELRETLQKYVIMLKLTISLHFLKIG